MSHDLAKKSATKPLVPVVIAQCVACGKRSVIGPGDVPAGEQPMCERCFSPMVPVLATARRAKR